MLVKGRSLFIYELKRRELKAPALDQPGEKLDLRWPAGQEKARGTKALERDQHYSRVRSQSEDMKSIKTTIKGNYSFRKLSKRKGSNVLAFIGLILIFLSLVAGTHYFA